MSTRPNPAHPGSLWNTQDTEFSHFSSLYDKSNPTDPFVIFENSQKFAGWVIGKDHITQWLSTRSQSLPCLKLIAFPSCHSPPPQSNPGNPPRCFQEWTSEMNASWCAFPTKFPLLKTNSGQAKCPLSHFVSQVPGKPYRQHRTLSEQFLGRR